MILVILSVAVLIFFFISIVNFNFQKKKYRYATDAVMERLPLFELPSTWLVCIIISAFLLAGTFVLCGKYVMGGLSDIERQQNNINQYQNEMSNQSTDGGQANLRSR